MAFQSAVRNRIANGIPGELAFDGPLRADPAVVNTTPETNNVFGRAFTLVTNPDPVAQESTIVQAGGTGVFYGLLSNPKEHVNMSGSAYTAEFYLRNSRVASFVKMGRIYVDFDIAATPGMQVAFNNTTGALVPIAAGGSAGAGETLIAGAKVIRYLGSVTAPYNGLAVVELT